MATKTTGSSKKGGAAKRGPKNAVMVEISKDTLDDLLKSKELAIGKNVRVIKALEISAGSVIARQYDR